MSDNRFDEFWQLVQRLWPRNRMSADEVNAAAWRRLSRYGLDEIQVALTQHRADDPESPHPKWSGVFALLRLQEQHNGSDGNPLHIYINAARRMFKAQGIKHVDDKTDADIWQMLVDGERRMILYDAVREEYKPDDNGILAKRAQEQIQNMAAYYVRELQRVAAEVPVWLEADMSGRLDDGPKSDNTGQA